MIIQIITVREIQDADYWNWARSVIAEGIPLNASRLLTAGEYAFKNHVPGITRVGTQYKIFRGMTLEEFVEKNGVETSKTNKRPQAKEGGASP